MSKDNYITCYVTYYVQDNILGVFLSSQHPGPSTRRREVKNGSVSVHLGKGGVFLFGHVDLSASKFPSVTRKIKEKGALSKAEVKRLASKFFAAAKDLMDPHEIGRIAAAPISKFEITWWEN